MWVTNVDSLDRKYGEKYGNATSQKYAVTVFFLCMVILVTGPECHWKLFYRDVISAIGIFKNINIYSVFVFRRFSVDFNLFINIIKIWICKSLLFSEFTFFRSFYSHWNWIYIFTLITIMMLILRRQYSSTFLKIIFICKCFDY